jgi:hypothetical protein
MTEADFILTGERAALGMLRREHLPSLARWFNDPEVRRGLAHRGLVNEDAELRWYEQVSEAAGAPRLETVPFAIGIFLGERRGSGIGGDATRLVLDWAFTILGLHNVMLETYDFNEQAKRAYERAGFKAIGRRRDAVRALGRRWDSVLMDATAEDYEEQSLRGGLARRLR